MVCLCVPAANALAIPALRGGCQHCVLLPHVKAIQSLGRLALWQVSCIQTFLHTVAKISIHAKTVRRIKKIQGYS